MSARKGGPSRMLIFLEGLQSALKRLVASEMQCSPLQYRGLSDLAAATVADAGIELPSQPWRDMSVAFELPLNPFASEPLIRWCHSRRESLKCPRRLSFRKRLAQEEAKMAEQREKSKEKKAQDCEELVHAPPAPPPPPPPETEMDASE